MKMLKFGVAAAIAATALPGAASAASIVTTGAQATTVADTRLDVGTNPNNFSIGFSDAELTNPFNELLTFTTTVAGLLSITVNTTATSSLDNVNFSSIFLTGGSLGGTPGTLSGGVLGGGPGVSLVQLLADPRDTFGFAGTSGTIQVAAGTYTLNIQGTPGTQNGAFGGSLAFNQSAAAVPEPGTWAMMLIGFGAVGFSMRRRRATAHLLQAA